VAAVRKADVSFGLALRDGRWLPESSLGGELPLDEATDPEDLEGAVIIAASGETEMRVEDALAPLAIWLCFNAVRELAADRPARVEAYSYHAETRLVPDGSWVEISGDVVPTVRVYRPALQEGLVACGERILAFFRRLGPPYDQHAALLEEPARLAREALAGAPTTYPGPDPAESCGSPGA
jgi:hypothetical protein